MKQGGTPSGEVLLALSTLAAIQLAEGKTADQITLLAAFLTVLADSLALIAVKRAEADGVAEVL